MNTQNNPLKKNKTKYSNYTSIYLKNIRGGGQLPPHDPT